MPTHQEALLRRALAERKLKPKRVVIDHKNGRAEIDDRTVGLIYPDSFFEFSEGLVGTRKTLRFHFAGDMRPGRGSGRPEMLAPFRGSMSVIRHGTWAKLEGNKGQWDQSYYGELATAEFGLCPHHKNWPGPWGTLWTYRFIDCLIVGTIPVLFRATPLALAFVDGFAYRWDDDEQFTFSANDALANRALAEKRFRL